MGDEFCKLIKKQIDDEEDAIKKYQNLAKAVGNVCWGTLFYKISKEEDNHGQALRTVHRILCEKG